MNEIRDGLTKITNIFELTDVDDQSADDEDRRSSDRSSFMCDDSDIEEENLGELRRKLKMKAARGLPSSPMKRTATKTMEPVKRGPDMCFDAEREVLEISYPTRRRRLKQFRSEIQREIDGMSKAMSDELRVPEAYKRTEEKQPSKSMEEILGV